MSSMFVRLFVMPSPVVSTILILALPRTFTVALNVSGFKLPPVAVKSVPA